MAVSNVYTATSCCIHFSFLTWNLINLPRSVFISLLYVSSELFSSQFFLFTVASGLQYLTFVPSKLKNSITRISACFYTHRFACGSLTRSCVLRLSNLKYYSLKRISLSLLNVVSIKLSCNKLGIIFHVVFTVHRYITDYYSPTNAKDNFSLITL